MEKEQEYVKVAIKKRAGKGRTGICCLFKERICQSTFTFLISEITVKKQFCIKPQTVQVNKTTGHSSVVKQFYQFLKMNNVY